VNLLDARVLDGETSGVVSRLENELRFRISEKQRRPVTTGGDHEMLDVLRALGYVDGSGSGESR